MTPIPGPHNNSDSSSLYPYLAATFCVVFGIVLIANVQTAGDQVWFWYATFFRDGNKLYSGMHLALQPLFLLETSWFMALLGNGWLVSKVPALLHLIAYCLGLFLITKTYSLSNLSKAAILLSVFFINIAAEGSRFDDYRALTDCFDIYSLVLLLKLSVPQWSSRHSYLAAGLGVLSGLTLMTRLNDGAALFVSVAISILFLAPARKLLLTALFCGAAALTVILTVHLTGDSFHDYAAYSIFKAAKIKGGAGNVLTYPLRLPWNTLKWLGDQWHQKRIVYAVAATVVWELLVNPANWRGDRRKLWKPVLGLGIILPPLIFVYHSLVEINILEWLSGVACLATYVLGILVVLRACRWIVLRKGAPWNQREILLLIPLGQIASGSMSSGARHFGMYGPLAFVLLLLPISRPIQIRNKHINGILTALLVVSVLNCVLYRIAVPYSWHSYRAKPLFVDRQWYRHPKYGPMIIETQQLELFQKICGFIATDTTPRDLLSLPLPYANYFCVIPPWHEYVQTFFDLSSQDMILTLSNELLTAPPHWILYQKQLDSMTLHETLYNQGKPLPHRYLDQVIEEKIASRAWQAVLFSTFGDRPNLSNQWIFIRTQPDAGLKP